MEEKQAARALALVEGLGVFRPRDLKPYGIARTTLQRLWKAGHIERVGRGLYMRADAAPTERHSLAEAATRVPHGVVCLLSALQFHGMTTQAPHHVWLAIGHKARRPVSGGLPLRIVRMSGRAFVEGVETHTVEGVRVQVYAPAKTVADCFKFRGRVGTDVATEALKAYRREQKGTIETLWHYAEVCRVANVMLPYLQMLA